MRAFVQLALVAAWMCAVTASPVPSSRYSESEGEQTVYKAEDHLFNDGGFPLRVRAHTQAFAGFGGGDGEGDGERMFRVPVAVAGGDQPQFQHPMSGFFFDMHDMMKILREQMSEVLARVPESSVGHEERLSPSDVKNQTTSKVEFLDGHKVVINDTTYSNGDTNHGSIFHVQIVDLLPLDPPAEDPEHEHAPAPAEDSEHSAPATPKTKISNEIDTKKGPEERDREEVEDNEDDIGEDIDEVADKETKPKPAKKVDRKEVKPVDKKEEKGVKKESKKDEKVEKREKVPDKEVEVFDDEPERAEDEDEGEDIPDREEKKRIHLLIRM